MNLNFLYKAFENNQRRNRKDLLKDIQKGMNMATEKTNSGKKYRKLYFTPFDIELFSTLLEEEAKRILLKNGISPFEREPSEVSSLRMEAKSYLLKLSLLYKKLQSERAEAFSLPWPLNQSQRPEELNIVPLPEEFYSEDLEEEY